MTFGPVLAMGINSIATAMLSIFGMIAEVDVTMTLLALAPVPLALAATSLLGSQVRKNPCACRSCSPDCPASSANPSPA
jgi:ABC-type multidrug transport system fused ATPase/permease subunit